MAFFINLNILSKIQKFNSLNPQALFQQLSQPLDYICGCCPVTSTDTTPIYSDNTLHLFPFPLQLQLPNTLPQHIQHSSVLGRGGPEGREGVG